MLNNTLCPTFILSSPGPIAFYIAMWPVRWYGIIIAVSFLICYGLAERLIKKNNLDLNSFNDLIFLVLIFGIVFARLYFVSLNANYFKDHLSEIPQIWLGGQSIHGGILGAIFAVFVFCRIKRISFFKYIDVFATVAPLGQSLGRWGNFFNNEAFGKPVDEWLIKLKIPLEYRPSGFLHNEYFHPTFLYESVLDFMLFVFIYTKFAIWKDKPGKIFWSYLFGYSLIRFCVEFLRTDSLSLFGNVASAHIMSIIIIVVSSFFLIRR